MDAAGHAKDSPHAASVLVGTITTNGMLAKCHAHPVWRRLTQFGQAKYMASLTFTSDRVDDGVSFL